MYLHSDNVVQHHDPLLLDHSLQGLGFGGSLPRPRLFIPESLEHCTADYLDKTFSPGHLLPMDALERFEIAAIEVWAVGVDHTKALQDRDAYRQRASIAIDKARTIHDKTFLAQDLQSGLVPNTLFEHSGQVRGSKEFVVDDMHGGYKVESH
jgi:hypothetical protein